MKIVKLTQNDDVKGVSDKCNRNFAELLASIVKLERYRGEGGSSGSDMDDLNSRVNQMTEQISEMQGQTDSLNSRVNQMTEQISEIQGQIEALGSSAPPVGAYVVAYNNPSNIYPGTSWTSMGTISVSGGAISTTTLWGRYA